MDVFRTLPPVSRTIALLALGTSTLGYAGIVDLYHFVFLPYRIIPDIWRLVTPFFVTRPKLGILLDSYFVFHYGSTLERDSSRFTGPGDFFYYVVIVGLFILLTGGYLINSVSLLQPLILAFAYTYAQDNPARRVSVYITTLDAKFLPFTMLLVTLVLDGVPATIVQLSGLFAAHAYEFLSRIWPTLGGGNNYLETPALIKGWFGNAPDAAARPAARPYGAAVPPRQSGPAPRATGTSFGFGGNWRGAGHRLGGE